MSEEEAGRGSAGRPGSGRPRSGRPLDWALAAAVLAATAAFALWAPGAARAVGAWIGFAP